MSEPSAKHAKGTTVCFPDSILELFILSSPMDAWGILMLVNERMHHLVTGVARRKGLEGVPVIKQRYANLSEDLHNFVYKKNMRPEIRRFEVYGLRRMMTPRDGWTIRNAALGGHFECLKYAHEEGCPWDEGTTKCAAINGHLKCLQYAHEEGCPWDKWTTAYAAVNGHLECLQYAHKEGCPWDKWTTAYAAMGGYLKCLQYAHENRCPWDAETTANAAINGHVKCLEYAVKHKCPYTEKRKQLAIEKGFVWSESE